MPKGVRNMKKSAIKGKKWCYEHNTFLCEHPIPEKIKPLKKWETELKRVEELLSKEKNLDKISFYEGYIKGLKYDR